MKCLYDANAKDENTANPENEKRSKAALTALEKADRPIQMARLLEMNSFDDEVHEAVWKAEALIEKAIYIRLYGENENIPEDLPQDTFDKMMEDAGLDSLSRNFIELSHKRLNANEKGLIKQCESTIAAVKSQIEKK